MYMLTLGPTHTNSIVRGRNSSWMHHLVKLNGKQAVPSHKTKLTVETVKPRGCAENLAGSLGSPDRKANK